jgi:hypothetical protein
VGGGVLGKFIHLAVALPDFSYVVFLREWPTSYQLLSAYYIEREVEREKYRRTGGPEKDDAAPGDGAASSLLPRVVDETANLQHHGFCATFLAVLRAAVTPSSY